MGPSTPLRRGFLRSFGSVAATTTDLVCCPHAGGTADFFRDWPALLGRDVHVAGVQYPGHGDRIREQPEREVATLATGLADEVADRADRTVLFGHSFGAAVAFETAAVLTRRGQAPRGVVVSARGAPTAVAAGGALDGSRAASAATMTESEVWREAERLGGTPGAIAADPEWRALLTPSLRADFHASATYRHDGPGLACPLSVVVGSEDADIPRGAVRAWRHHTTSTFTIRLVPGGHFYLLERPGPVAEEVVRMASPHSHRARSGTRQGTR